MSHPTDKHCDTCVCDSGSFLAVVPTDYEIYAVASTEEEAKTKALNAAREWVNARFVADGLQPRYKDNAEVEEWLGCNVFPLSIYGVGQEG